MFKQTLAAVALALIAGTTFAQTSTPGVDLREANQAARIQQGVNSGALTGREATRLEAGQARVDRIEARAKSDGVVTGAERARLQQAQNVQSRHIYRQKHDRQVAR